MEDFISPINSFLSFLKEVYPLFDQIKKTLTPQYAQAATGLEKAINKILYVQNTYLDWIRKYEQENLDHKRNPEFDRFELDFDKFINSPEARNLGIRCEDIIKIYHEEIESGLKDLFKGNKEKWKNANNTFEGLKDADRAVVQSSKNILGELQKSLHYIKYQDADPIEVRKEYLRQVYEDRMKLQRQSDQLAEMLQKFQEVAFSKTV